eukprot:TRINITY_DN15072_c0_g1_i1.p1 TRINITY_DN15072_c0_g1~~TRINITY_DN15072_c0_g1_i1.p1  ORF type:complete len:100 (+),score=4.97 TRINITY_DN15072_c0_g1_i1:254-553(+)
MRSPLKPPNVAGFPVDTASNLLHTKMLPKYFSCAQDAFESRIQRSTSPEDTSEGSTIIPSVLPPVSVPIKKDDHNEADCISSMVIQASKTFEHSDQHNL